MENRAYLVPHDFTAVGDSAARYAVHLSLQSNANVHLLHVVKSDSEKAGARKKLEEVIQKMKAFGPNVKFEIHIEAGSIFTDIAKVAEKIHASLIIMGTHGAKGVSQKLFGSFAIKVITSTSCPFVIVQDKVPSAQLKKIVFPINLNSESLQVSKVAGVLATDFNAEIHMVAPKEKQLDLSQKLIIYSELVKKELAKLNIKAQTQFLDKSQAYHDAIVQYAKANAADLIAITYHSEAMLPQFDPYAQTLITNSAKIPVLIINGKDAGNYYF